MSLWSVCVSFTIAASTSIICLREQSCKWNFGYHTNNKMRTRFLPSKVGSDIDQHRIQPHPCHTDLKKCLFHSFLTGKCLILLNFFMKPFFVDDIFDSPVTFTAVLCVRAKLCTSASISHNSRRHLRRNEKSRKDFH